jgi:hypothetical protein
MELEILLFKQMMLMLLAHAPHYLAGSSCSILKIMLDGTGTKTSETE